MFIDLRKYWSILYRFADKDFDEDFFYDTVKYTCEFFMHLHDSNEKTKSFGDYFDACFWVFTYSNKIIDYSNKNGLLCIASTLVTRSLLERLRDSRKHRPDEPLEVFVLDEKFIYDIYSPDINPIYDAISKLDYKTLEKLDYPSNEEYMLS